MADHPGQQLDGLAALTADARASAVEQLRQATRYRTRAHQQYTDADTVWRERIRAALTAGVPPRDVRKLTGLSPARIYQIKDGRR